MEDLKLTLSKEELDESFYALTPEDVIFCLEEKNQKISKEDFTDMLKFFKKHFQVYDISEIIDGYIEIYFQEKNKRKGVK